MKNLNTIALLCTLVSMGLVITVLWLPKDRTRPEPTIVTVDLVELTANFTLDLAAGNLSDKDIKAQSRLWADRLQEQLRAIARDNNLVIIPRAVGVYGADDITAMIRDANDSNREVPE